MYSHFNALSYLWHLYWVYQAVCYFYIQYYAQISNETKFLETYVEIVTYKSCQFYLFPLDFLDNI